MTWKKHSDKMKAQLRLTGDTEKVTPLYYTRVIEGRKFGDFAYNIPCFALGKPYQTSPFGGSLAFMSNYGTSVFIFEENFEIRFKKQNALHFWKDEFLDKGKSSYHSRPYVDLTNTTIKFKVIISNEGICLISKGFHILLYDFWKWIWEDFKDE